MTDWKVTSSLIVTTLALEFNIVAHDNGLLLKAANANRIQGVDASFRWLAIINKYYNDPHSEYIGHDCNERRASIQV